MHGSERKLSPIFYTSIDHGKASWNTCVSLPEQAFLKFTLQRLASGVEKAMSYTWRHTHVREYNCNNKLGAVGEPPLHTYSSNYYENRSSPFNLPYSADVDECALGFNKCEQFCVNTIGSYICVCFPGYHLLTNGFSCSGECKCMRYLS